MSTVQQNELKLEGQSWWLVLTLFHAKGLGAINDVGRMETVRPSADRIALPEISVRGGGGGVSMALREAFVIMHDIFGL